MTFEANGGAVMVAAFFAMAMVPFADAIAGRGRSKRIAELEATVQNLNAALAIVNADNLALEKRMEMLETNAGLRP